MQRAYWLESWFWKHKVKFFWQRRTRGFDDSTLWDLDYTILKFILPRLKAFRQVGAGYPASFYYGEDCSSEDIIRDSTTSIEERATRSNAAHAEWKAAIDKMIYSIEVWVENDGMIDHDFVDGELVPTPDRRAKFEEGWELFHKYFFGLWD